MAEVEAALATILPKHTAASTDFAQRQTELTDAEQQRDALLDKQSRTVQVGGWVCHIVVCLLLVGMDGHACLCMDGKLSPLLNTCVIAHAARLQYKTQAERDAFLTEEIESLSKVWGLGLVSCCQCLSALVSAGGCSL
jgi:hypothetical protein